METKAANSFSIFKISFYWYAVVGTFFIWLTSIVLSFIIPSDKKELDQKLLSPIVRSFVTDGKIEAEEVPLKVQN